MAKDVKIKIKIEGGAECLRQIALIKAEVHNVKESIIQLNNSLQDLNEMISKDY